MRRISPDNDIIQNYIECQERGEYSECKMIYDHSDLETRTRIDEINTNDWCTDYITLFTQDDFEGCKVMYSHASLSLKKTVDNFHNGTLPW